jgi:hypothetical protein
MELLAGWKRAGAGASVGAVCKSEPHFLQSTSTPALGPVNVTKSKACEERDLASHSWGEARLDQCLNFIRGEENARTGTEYKLVRGNCQTPTTENRDP